jgi:hypothetical protein
MYRLCLLFIVVCALSANVPRATIQRYATLRQHADANRRLPVKHRSPYVPKPVALTTDDAHTVAGGVHMHLDACNHDATQCRALIGQLKQLGFRLLRVPFDWSLIEPTLDVFDMSRLDLLHHLAAFAADSGMQLMAVLNTPPDWAVDMYTDDIRYYNARYFAFVMRAMNHVKHIQYVQLGRALNNPFMSPWQYDTAALYRTIITGASAVKTYNARIVVVVDYDTAWDGLRYADTRTAYTAFIDAVCAKAGKFVDVLAPRYPGGLMTESFADHSPLQELLTKVANHTDPCFNKSVGVSDLGHPTPNHRIMDTRDAVLMFQLTEAKQQQYATEALAALHPILKQHASTVKFAIWADAVDVAPKLPAETTSHADTGQHPAVPLNTLLLCERHMGLLHSDFTEKPCVSAVRQWLVELP